MGKRPYTSNRRRQQAEETKSRIVEAARRLFTTRGYPGTTVEAIAGEAGVAPETVYASFGAKAKVLARLLQVSVLGDMETGPLLERPGPRAVLRETDQRRQITMFAADIRSIMERVSPLFGVMRAAAADPQIGELLRATLRQRLSGMAAFVSGLTRNGALRRGLDRTAAAETVWALTSAELFLLLRKDRGWSAERYEAWLADCLSALLLP